MWHVDPTHNTFITTGNAGKEPTAAEVMLFYNGGKSKYRMEKMLAPGEQLWIDMGHLVHDQVPDSDGNTLPLGTMTGSYELRDLDHAYVGQLYEGKLVVDKTYGHAAYGCGNCCGYNPPYFGTDPFGGPPNLNFTESVDSLEACGGGIVDVTGIGYDWKSNNTAVATLPNKVLHTVAVGSCNRFVSTPRSCVLNAAPRLRNPLWCAMCAASCRNSAANIFCVSAWLRILEATALAVRNGADPGAAWLADVSIELAA
jgi:hypothetical protein